MGKHKIFRNVMLCFLIVLGFMFVGEEVEAAECTYTFDNGTYPIRIFLNVDPETMVMTWKEGFSYGIGNTGKEEAFSINGKMGAITKTTGKTCPSLVLYRRDGIGNATYELYESGKDCPNCSSNHFLRMSEKPVFTATEDEKFTPQACEKEEIENYNIAINDLSKQIDEIYNTYRSKAIIESSKIIKTEVTTVERAKNNLKIIQDNYGSEMKRVLADVQALSEIFFCKEVVEQIDSHLTIIGKMKENKLNDLEMLVFEGKFGAEMKSDDPEIQKVLDEAKQNTKSVNDQLNEIINSSKNELGVSEIVSDVAADCQAILGDLLKDIQNVFGLIKIIAPILLIFFGSMDFAKAVVSSDDNMMKKATSSFIKRAIAAVAVFFLPFLIELLFSLPGIKENVTSSVCGISKVVIKW